ncbi:hypothetical protein [Streptosporangium sandarakinum]|uniref:hypothetical protein n=1 Tax=Streptosporangium sandarakinum TaxID=1260955 RepID=UPI00343CD2A5
MTSIVFAAAAADGDVSPGVLGFLVVAAIGFALFLLVKSMRKQISKIDLPADRDPRKPGENA